MDDDKTQMSESLLGGGDSSAVINSDFNDDDDYNNTNTMGVNFGNDDDETNRTSGQQQQQRDELTLLFGQRHNNNHDDDTNQQQQSPQIPEYRDAPFAIAFLLHAVVVVVCSIAWGFSALKQQQQQPSSDEDDYDNNNQEDGNNNSSGNAENVYNLSGLIWLSLITCLVSLGISAMSLKVMMHHAEILIQGSLIGSCCFLVLFAILFFIDNEIVIGTVWTVCSLFTAYYAKCVWNRIPFAAANLRTALSAIQTNAGVCVLAYGIAIVAMVWTVIWSLAVIGVSFKESTCSGGSSTGDVCQLHMNAVSIVCLILSYFWTSQVLKNVLHVTVSGVIGTWWFYPQDALSVFSPAIIDSFRRATTYSFGSICMGSLLVAIIQTMEAIAKSARQNNRDGILLCIVECLLQMLARIAIYFNKWAYCYVGLYGFDYISSGKKAMELFEARGWTTIITDDLVQRSLTLITIVISALSGIVGMVLSKAVGWSTSSGDDGIVFFACFLIGFSVAQIFISVVVSAVDTVIVAFAEAPAEFNTHHPALYNNMVQKWRLVFPQECGF